MVDYNLVARTIELYTQRCEQAANINQYQAPRELETQVFASAGVALQKDEKIFSMIGQIPFRSLGGTRILVPDCSRIGTGQFHITLTLDPSLTKRGLGMSSAEALQPRPRPNSRYLKYTGLE